jgi:hypothetical protein
MLCTHDSIGLKYRRGAEGHKEIMMNEDDVE